MSLPLIKDGPVYPVLKENTENSTRSYHGCCLDTSESFHSVSNCPKQLLLGLDLGF